MQAVRQSAIEKLKPVAESFGAKWTVEHLLPKIVEQYSQSAAYANRLTTLAAISSVAEVLSAEQVGQAVIPLLLKALKDSVPNVRFTACRAIARLGQLRKVGSAAQSQIKATLQELEQDSDVDVQYFAGRALLAC